MVAEHRDACGAAERGGRPFGVVSASQGVPVGSQGPCAHGPFRDPTETKSLSYKTNNLLALENYIGLLFLFFFLFLIAMASNLLAMACTLVVMASNQS